MTDLEIKAALDDLAAVALTMYGEARGDLVEGSSSVEERIAVGCVIRNRVARPARFGGSFRAVCLARLQFSCWAPAGGAANYGHVMQLARLVLKDGPPPVLTTLEAQLLEESQFLAEGIVGGQLLDATRGSTHYYAPRAMKPAGTVPPWALGKLPLAKIGGHLFFRAA